jgi:hypothetical protein
MPVAVTCWFCGNGAFGHDHDECARNYGAPVDIAYLNMSRTHGPQMAMDRFETELRSPNYQAYKLYLARAEEAKLLNQHMVQIRSRVQEEVKSILTHPASVRALAGVNVARNGTTFKVQLEVIATVTPDTVC